MSFTVLKEGPMLDDIRWEFGSQRYLSLEQFVTEVSRVNKSAWPHDEIINTSIRSGFPTPSKSGLTLNTARPSETGKALV